MRTLATAGLLLALAAAGGISAETPRHVENPSVTQGLPSFLGHVPDRFIVVLKEGVAVDHAKDLRAPTALAALPGFADLQGRFQVKALRPQFPGADRQTRAAGDAGRLARHYKVTIGTGSLDEAMAAYGALPDVDHVEPIGIHTLFALPNDPYYDNPPPEYPYDQWHYWDSYGIRAHTAWDSETGDPAVIVGDLDIGTMYNHGDLGGSNPPGPNDASTNGNIWVNAYEVPGNGIDDDGNGYTDDLIGWDFVDRTDWYSYPCIDIDCGGADNDPSDGNGHGTHTAGTIAAITNNGYAVAGVAGGYGEGTFAGGGTGVKVVPCRIGYVLDYWIYGPTGVVIMDYVAEAMYYMANLKLAGWNVAAINCSFGSSNSGGLGAAADFLIAQDVVICVAAGNSSSSTPSYLGGRGDCLDVAATDQSGNNASFTNYGSWVDIAAPGVSVLSTITDPADPGVDYIATMDGTSMACPHAAGVVALLESFNPGLSAAQKIALITDPANTNPYGGSRDLGAGIIDARKCLDAAGGGCDLAADFSGTPVSGCLPLTVNFTDLSTGTGIDGWAWTFGDGGTSTASNPGHTYYAAGTYTVTLTITSSNQGCNAQAAKAAYITVNSLPSAAFVGSPTSGQAPLTVTFTSQSTNATAFSWDFGDGGTSTAQNPSHSYAAAGTYTVALTASGACGSDTETKVGYITVTEPPQLPPAAEFTGSPTSGTAPLTVQFTDLSANAPIVWSWDFGDGGASTAQNPSHTYTAAGTYTVSLTATNAYGSDTETKLGYISVSELPQATRAYPSADLPAAGTVTGTFARLAASDNVSQTITEVLYTGHPVKTYSYLEHKWTIDVGSGGAAMMFVVEASRPANSDNDNIAFAYSTDNAAYTTLVTVASAAEQAYSAALPAGITGTVYIRAVDTDRNWGKTSLDQVAIDQMYIEYTAGPTAPNAQFAGIPASGAAPLTVQFSDLSTGGPTAWSWTFGDGDASAAQNPSHAYSAVGTYTVTLTVSNAYGSDAETKTDYITVTDPNAAMHVGGMAVTRAKVGANYFGGCVVTIVDQNGSPVGGATVSAAYDGATSGSTSGVTAGDGTVTLRSSGVKKPSGEWCFTVTNVAHASLAYQAAANAVTRACESGWVYGEDLGPLARTAPAGFDLAQNYPNPLNPATEISFSLPTPQHATLEVFNVVGQRVAVLADASFGAGIHTVTWDASRVSSGMYFYRLTAEGFVETKKMLLLK